MSTTCSTARTRWARGSSPRRIRRRCHSRMPTGELPGTPANYLYANTNAVLKLTSILTNTFVNEARVSFQRNRRVQFQRRSVHSHATGHDAHQSRHQCHEPDHCPGLFNVGGGIGDDVFDPTDQFQVADTISWSHGRHTIRAGFEVEHINWDIVFKGIERGNTTVYSFPDFLIGRAGCTPGDATCTPATPGDTNGTALSNIASCLFCVRSGPDGIIHGYRANNINAFVQDDFKVNSASDPEPGRSLGIRRHAQRQIRQPHQRLAEPGPQHRPCREIHRRPGSSGRIRGAVELPGRRLPAGVFKIDRNLPVKYGPPLDNFGPRFGFAWQPTDRKAGGARRRGAFLRPHWRQSVRAFGGTGKSLCRDARLRRASGATRQSAEAVSRRPRFRLYRAG